MRIAAFRHTGSQYRIINSFICQLFRPNLHQKEEKDQLKISTGFYLRRLLVQGCSLNFVNNYVYLIFFNARNLLVTKKRVLIKKKCDDICVFHLRINN